MDGTDDMLWNGSEEEGDVKSDFQVRHPRGDEMLKL